MEFHDYHAHTNLSYCCDGDVTPERYVEAIERDDELKCVAITNHGFAIYFPEATAWQWQFMSDPRMFDEQREWGNRRLLRHLDEVDAYRDRGLLTGVEAEMMCDGRLTVDPDLGDRLDVIVGSIHSLEEDWHHGSTRRMILDEWVRHTKALVRAGIDVLGHPMRWLAGQIREVPEELIPMVVALARDNDVALEINAHYVVDTDVPLLKEAVRVGAKVTFCTDAHRLDEIGQTRYHLRLLEHAGLSVDDLTFWHPSRRR